jgi:hypothetical protein
LPQRHPESFAMLRINSAKDLLSNWRYLWLSVKWWS